MCPFCFASAAYAVAGTVSTGGLAALAVKISRRKSSRDNTRTNVSERSHQYVSQHDHESEDCIPG